MPTPIVFLPGLLCDDRLWREQVAELGGYVADLTSDDTVDAMACRTLDAAPERFALCALSMGGYVALAIMRRAPERVERLCLMDTSARADTAEQAQRRRGLMAMTRGNRFRGVTPRLLPMLVHPDRLNDADLTADVMTMAERVGRDAFLRQQTAILTRPDSRPDLAAIRVPTYVVVGREDALTPVEHAREIADGISGARLQIIERSGHLTPMERPTEVTRLLRAWLDGETLEPSTMA